MTPLFSIILPTYNRAYVIWKAILSIQAQSASNWELIVVDDGSTDCTQRLLEEFQDHRIRTLVTPNRGPSAARNHGVAHAQAPYIAYLDSDNIWHPTFLETMHKAIQEHPHCVLWHCGANGTFWERRKNGDWRHIKQFREPAHAIGREDVWKLDFADTNNMVHCREVCESIGGWDEDCRWLEDWDFFLRVFLRYPGQIQHVSEILVEYRQVHGEGADGLCGEARESRVGEVAARHYLLAKWRHHPDFAAEEKLSIAAEKLKLQRPKPD